ncbi:hypothetical protein GCM10029992_20890 [Glycomyces albus]
MNRPGLRERKKLETLHRMQEEAMRLFEEQGYDETTIEQIAEAAGVSPRPSTATSRPRRT